MGELETYIDSLIKRVKDPEKRKDLISRLKAAQSKEQPLDKLTDGKLEEIEKLKKKLNKVNKLNKSLVKITKRKYQRSTGVGGPFSNIGRETKPQEDPRLRTTGAGTGWRGFTEKPEVKQTLPRGHEKKPATTFAVHRRQEHGAKAPLSKLVPTGVKTDDPTATSQGGGSTSPINLPTKDPRGKDSASPTHGTPAKQGKITTATADKKSKRQRGKDFLKRLVGRGKKDEKLAQGQTPRPTSSTVSNQSKRQASQQNYQQSTTQDKTSQTATAEAGIPVNPPKKEKKETKQESDKDALKRLAREHEEAKKKREEIFEGKGKKETPKKETKDKPKKEKPKGKKSQKKKITEFLDIMGKKEGKKEGKRKVSQRKEIDDMLKRMMDKPTQASIWRKRGRKNAAIIKAMADFLEKDASGYGDLGVANVYPMDSYDEPSLIGKPVGEIKTPINDSETYILNGQNKDKGNEQDN